MANSSAKLTSSRVAIQRALAAWFGKHRRALPWRTERSLYRTVVSEFMLQQTQVATVLPYFHRWMMKLPTFAALAVADEADVMKLWEGLGYYRRARFLQRLARAFVVLPAAPQTAAEWETLPGVGPYTAAAIASIACDDAAACVDGNVVRILARLTGETRAFPDGSSAVKHFTPLASALLDARHPGRHNESMMELGATVCLRRKPLCTLCPVAEFCVAQRKGIADDIPRIARAPTEQLVVDRVWHVRDGALLLHRIPETARRMGGLYELPTTAQAGVGEAMLATHQPLATHRRAITRFQITERIFPALCTLEPDAERAASLEWIPLARLAGITLSGPHRRWVTALVRTL